MVAEFLRNLPISEETQRELASRGASTPLALLRLRKAKPTDFDRFIGADQAGAVFDAVYAMLSETEKDELNAPSAPPRSLGGRRGPAPQMLEPSFDLAKREQLFQELRSLRRQERTTQRDQRIAAAEAELNALVSRR